MENYLLEFVSTLEDSLKKIHGEVGVDVGIARMTINQFRYIDTIHTLAEPSISAIADRMTITKASVTAGVQKLIRMGFVIKTQSTADKRVFHVRLSLAGERLIKAKYKAVREYENFIRAALSDQEARQLEKILTKLVWVFKNQSQHHQEITE
jgi:DNA-binding MarR family transcriptional regulator